MPNPDSPGTVNNNQATVNDRTGLYLAIVAVIIASIALGMVIIQPQLTDAKIGIFQATLDLNSNRAQVSENHWRNLEVQQAADHAEIERLKNERRR